MENFRGRAGGSHGVPVLVMQLFAEDRHALRRLEANTHLVAPDGNDCHSDVVANDNLLIDFAAQDQHGKTSLCTKIPAELDVRPVDGKSIDPLRSEIATCGNTSHLKREKGMAEIPGSFLEICQCMQCQSRDHEGRTLDDCQFWPSDDWYAAGTKKPRSGDSPPEQGYLSQCFPDPS